MADFFSSFDIDDSVTFTPMYRHVQDWGIAPEELEGRIIAVRFTEAKVFYDIYNNYWGRIFDGIVSERVESALSNIFVPQGKIEQIN